MCNDWRVYPTDGPKYMCLNKKNIKTKADKNRKHSLPFFFPPSHFLYSSSCLYLTLFLPEASHSSTDLPYKGISIAYLPIESNKISHTYFEFPHWKMDLAHSILTMARSGGCRAVLYASIFNSQPTKAWVFILRPWLEHQIELTWETDCE